MAEEAREEVLDDSAIKDEMEANLAEEEQLEASDSEPEHTEAELEAMDKGWNPEGVEGKPNLSADEFLRNESFFKEIHKLKREQRKSTEVIQALKEHNKQTEQKAYEKAVKELRAAKKAAAKDEDLERVIELDEQLEDLQESKKAVEEVTPQEGMTEADFKDAYETFVDSNIWYGRNRDMTNEAEMIYEQYSNKHPNALPEDRFDHLMKEMKTSFPEEFGNKKRGRPSAVSAPSKSGAPSSAKKKHSLADVDEADRAIANTLIKTGTMSEEDYLADYFQD